MPFREKVAWISLICFTAFGLFFVAMGHGIIHSRVPRAGLFFGSLAVVVALRIVLYLVAAARAPEDARAPIDERERLIGLKSARNANFALIAGVLMVPLSMHAGARAPDMAYVAMMALVVAEIVREISRIRYFRMGR